MVAPSFRSLKRSRQMKPAVTQWNPGVYSTEVSEILALAESGERLMPLAEGVCSSEQARDRIKNAKAGDLFPSARAPRAALAGLYLYFSCREEAHEVAQSDSSAEGSYWHAIVHRQEPDAGNSSYWFHRVGEHPVFSGLLEAARAVGAAHPDAAVKFSNTWDPLGFIEICEQARRRPGSALERAALEIQRAEWQLLFEYCARRSPY
jgi:hypothetical protein